MATLTSARRQRIRALLARPIRFGAVGVVSSVVQLSVLALLVESGLHHDLANIAAIIVATQVNFLLSARVIWPDRPTSLRQPRALARRLIAFNGMSATTLLINEGVFAVAVHYVPYLAAGACGIAVAAPINYLVGHYLIFRRHEGDHTDEPGHVRLRHLPGL